MPIREGVGELRSNQSGLEEEDGEGEDEKEVEGLGLILVKQTVAFVNDVWSKDGQ